LCGGYLMIFITLLFIVLIYLESSVNSLITYYFSTVKALL
jgi:hypothetical protein